MRKNVAASSSTDKVKSLVRHINEQNPNYAATRCPYHFHKACLTILNNRNQERFHCLFANSSVIWRAYSASKSCDIPEHFYDMLQLTKLLGREYVLPFSGHFRESTGYCIGMFRQPAEAYPPSIVKRSMFKETLYATIVFLCAVCHRLGGVTPNIKHFSFLFTESHPILADIGSVNAESRERISTRVEHFNAKKWKKFLQNKTTRDVIRYMRVLFPNFFQKKRNGCVLADGDDEVFDDETHQLVCKCSANNLADILFRFRHLMPDHNIRHNVVRQWIMDAMPALPSQETL